MVKSAYLGDYCSYNDVIVDSHSLQLGMLMGVGLYGICDLDLC